MISWINLSFHVVRNDVLAKEFWSFNIPVHTCPKLFAVTRCDAAVSVLSQGHRIHGQSLCHHTYQVTVSLITAELLSQDLRQNSKYLWAILGNIPAQ